MNGTFEARLRRVTQTSRSARSENREVTVTNPVAVIETRFSYPALNRLYDPNFVAVDREFNGETTYLIFEIVSVSPMHFQMLGMDVTMPTVLRNEYLDTISRSWGKSRETWIDLTAVPTWYMMTVRNGTVGFEHSRVMPLAGAKVHLLSRSTVERFLCFEDGESVGRLIGFDFPLTVNLDNLIRFHSCVLGFSVDYNEPFVYRENGKVKTGRIGDFVDKFYSADEEGPVKTSGREVVCFDRETFRVKWAPVQYVYRHRYGGKLLRFKLRTGRNVTVTPGHSLFVLRNGRVETARASEIRPGDHVVGANTVPGGELRQKLDLVKFFESHGEEIRLSGIAKESVPRGFLANGGRIREWRWRKRLRIPISSARLLAPEVLEKTRVTYKGYEHGLPPLLDIDEAFAELLGYYAAEGHVAIRVGGSYNVQLTLGEKDRHILDEVVAFAKRWGMRWRVSKHGERAIRITISNRLLAELLGTLVGKGARNKRVPSIIMSSPPSVRRAFLRAWIEGDYGVTASSPLMSDVMYLLLMEGCIATVSLWSAKKPTIIEGRTVNAGTHYQMRFPKVKEVLAGDFRKKRDHSEPTVPIRKLSTGLVRLYPNALYLRQVNLRTNANVLDALQSRLNKLLSYSNIPAKSATEARHDGYYRLHMNTYFVRNGNMVQPTPLLVQLPDDLAEARKLSQSDLAFFEVLDVEQVEPSSPFVYDVSVPGAENFMAGFGGVFCHNTGSGKSNLTSTLIKKVMSRVADLMVVVLDVSGEYATSLIDIMENEGRILSTEPLDNEERLFGSLVIPESLEEAAETQGIQRVFSGMLTRGLVRTLSVTGDATPLDLAAVEELLRNTAEDGKTGSMAARIALERFERKFYVDLELQPSAKVSNLGEQVKSELAEQLGTLKQAAHEKSGLRSEVDALLGYLDSSRPEEAGKDRGSTPESLASELVRGMGPRLNVLYVPEPDIARSVASRLIDRLLFLRKRGGSRKRVLVVLDEAQEYMTDNPREKDKTFHSNRAVEALLRQGRKYRLHCWLATQRIAHLNPSALQQVHSYFVSTLPRFYDRLVVAESFGLPVEVMDRSSHLDTGEWIFVSFKATKQKNVPVFIRSENNEARIAEYLKSKKWVKTGAV